MWKGTGVEWNAARVWVRVRIWSNVCGVEWARVGQIRCGRCIWASAYPLMIWARYGECRSVHAFGLEMGLPVGWHFFVQALTGQPVRTFGAGIGDLVVDALTTYQISIRVSYTKF